MNKTIINKFKFSTKIYLANILLASSCYAINNTSLNTNNLVETMQAKAQLELTFAQSSDFATYEITDQVASAWRLARLHIDESLSRSGNRFLFDSDQALRLASFAYDTGEREQVEVSNDEYGSAIAILARWHFFFGNQDKYTDIKSLCDEYFGLSLEPGHRHFKYMKNLNQAAKENLSY